MAEDRGDKEGEKLAVDSGGAYCTTLFVIPNRSGAEVRNLRPENEDSSVAMLSFKDIQGVGLGKGWFG